ncbi:MAG: AraC family ligand binding domain-containing protein, partial [Capsulimonas sp.]|uniref:AraC family ligand binding domain-containing protein n=1 Tax=Capsulimonas sp. TaxID=2494211 RepID=UPI00326509C7
MTQDSLSIPFSLPITYLGGVGMFVSPGAWRHGKRLIDDYVLMFVRTGVLHMQEEDQRFDVKPNEILMLAPGRQHEGFSHEAQDLSYLWMHFRLSEPIDASPEMTVSLPQHRIVSRPERLEALFRLLVGDNIRKTTSLLSRNMLACCILSEVAQEDASQVENDDSKIVANRASTFIHTHFTQPISASDVAAAVACNPKYLARVYREVYHETMTQY